MSRWAEQTVRLKPYVVVAADDDDDDDEDEDDDYDSISRV